MTTTREVSADQIPSRRVTGPAFWMANTATRMARSKERMSAICPMSLLLLDDTLGRYANIGVRDRQARQEPDLGA
jgi:hypothetical protein